MLYLGHIFWWALCLHGNTQYILEGTKALTYFVYCKAFLFFLLNPISGLKFDVNFQK